MKFPNTIIKEYKRCRIVLTQQLDERFLFGHYNYYIQDSNGNVLHAGHSTGGPKNEMKGADVREIIEQWYKDNLDGGGEGK